MADWSAADYLRFEDERTRPARDLLARVPLDRPRRVVDVGCGPGNSTALLVERWPDAEVIGIDTSPAMLAEARARLPDVAFLEADVARFAPDRPVDLVFANAVLQWVPDHLALLGRLMDHLAPGGVLAVQMPDNVAEPSHRAMVTAAEGTAFAARLAGAARAPLPSAAAHFEAVAGKAAAVDVWHTIYNHPLAGPDAVVDWVRSTGLKPFLDRLDGEERTVYLERYRALVAAAYPQLSDGRVLLRFPRLFLVAVRAKV